MNTTEPRTLVEAIRRFSDLDYCREYLAAKRWPNGVVCPVCGAAVTTFIKSENAYQCSKRHPKRRFSIKTGTVMEDSPLTLDKWLTAMWLICNAKNGISSYEVMRALDVTQKTAWFLLHRVRYVMQSGTMEKLVDHVEVDETYIGGKARNMHPHIRKQRIKGTGGAGSGKAVVMGMLERGGKVVTKHIEKADRKTLQGHIKANVDKGATVSTDALPSYKGLSAEYVHGVVDHAVAYVEAPSTRTAWRTTGAFSNGPSAAPTSRSNLSTCTVISMSSRSATTSGTRTTAGGSGWSPFRSPGSGSPTGS